MQIFLSWSGDCSKAVASALCEWLPCVIPGAQPWVSSRSIEPGRRWSAQLDAELEAADFGVLCLVPENFLAPWLVFEAGALSKRVSTSRVIPYCAGLAPGDVKGPLARFQGISANEPGTLSLIHALNATLDHPQTDDTLTRVFRKWWPDLKLSLHKVNAKILETIRRRDAELINWPKPLAEPFCTRAGSPKPQETDFGYTITELYNNPSDRIVSYISATQHPAQTSQWHMLKAAPGERPFEARYIVVKGRARFDARRESKNGRTLAYVLKPGDSLLIPDSWWCRFQAVGRKELEMLVVCIPRWNDDRYRVDECAPKGKRTSLEGEVRSREAIDSHSAAAAYPVRRTVRRSGTLPKHRDHHRPAPDGRPRPTA